MQLIARDRRVYVLFNGVINTWRYVIQPWPFRRQVMHGEGWGHPTSESELTSNDA